MNLHVVGVSHHKSPVEVRERLALSREQVHQVLELWRKEQPDMEAVLLCTCNRTEVYFAMEQKPGVDAQAIVKGHLSDLAEMPLPQLEPYLFQHDDRDAVEHLFRVASSLDSMVLGETQITSQVRRAYVRTPG